MNQLFFRLKNFFLSVKTQAIGAIGSLGLGLACIACFACSISTLLITLGLGFLVDWAPHVKVPLLALGSVLSVVVLLRYTTRKNSRPSCC
ncbi:MAG: hypothetical protein AB7T49_20005 [Oligoflexales bacterium]